MMRLHNLDLGDVSQRKREEEDEDLGLGEDDALDGLRTFTMLDGDEND